jgi:hypothetical protein
MAAPDLRPICDIADAVLVQFDARFPAKEGAVPEKTPVPTDDEPWYNWSNAPRDAFAAAVDSEGYAHWCCFIAKDGRWCAIWRIIPSGDFSINGCPWHKSLRQRPGKEATSEA